MSDDGLSGDQRDLPPRWHLGAVLGAALALVTVYSIAVWLFL
jgi:hypothetical protein